MGRRLSEYCHKYWIWISKNQALSTLFWALHFLLVRSKIPTFGHLSGLPGARSARFFNIQGFRLFGTCNRKILLAGRGLPLDIGKDWVLAL